MIDVVMITNYGRPDTVKQSLKSLHENGKDLNVTVVLDGYGLNGSGMADCYQMDNLLLDATRLIVNNKPVGASASRNIGASSIPKYRRGEYVMFIDDDVYMCPGWDEQLVNVMQFGDCVLSGHAHPFNSTVVGVHGSGTTITNVLSTVHMFMPWEIWDEVGYWVEPGGPGGSEDYEWCMRATAMSKALVVTSPHCVIHTGLTSSKGERIVGYEHVVKRNAEIEKVYGLEGRVKYA